MEIRTTHDKGRAEMETKKPGDPIGRVKTEIARWAKVSFIEACRITHKKQKKLKEPLRSSGWPRLKKRQ